MSHNPIERWSQTRFWAAFVALLLLSAACVIGIVVNDRALASTCTKSSAALEWVSRPSAASNIVADWQARGVVGVVTCGLLIDYLFIVFYSTLLAISVFRCAGAVPLVKWWSSIGDRLGWWMWVAGALDALENAGILLELHAHAYSLAPAIALVARMKWTVIAVGGLYIAFTGILWLRVRAADDDPGLLRELSELRLPDAAEEEPAVSPPMEGSTIATR